MRIVALFDYWSQLVLRPYHKALNECLQKIRHDCTFDQRRVEDLIQNDGAWKYSVDLSSATDRFPM